MKEGIRIKAALQTCSSFITLFHFFSLTHLSFYTNWLTKNMLNESIKLRHERKAWGRGTMRRDWPKQNEERVERERRGRTRKWQKQCPTMRMAGDKTRDLRWCWLRGFGGPLPLDHDRLVPDRPLLTLGVLQRNIVNSPFKFKATHSQLTQAN